MPGHDPVAEVDLLGQAEVGSTVGHEGVQLDEAARVEQEVESLAGGQLASCMLLLDARLASTKTCLVPHPPQALDAILGFRHSCLPSLCKDGTILAIPPGSAGFAALDRYPQIR